MKARLIILVLAIATQPVQAAFCVMMADSPTAIEQSADSDHDCCDTESVETESDCADSMNCGNCFFSTTLLSAIERLAPPEHEMAPEVVYNNSLQPSHSVPPFRPPIS